jgi:hypothetical protein
MTKLPAQVVKDPLCQMNWEAYAKATAGQSIVVQDEAASLTQRPYLNFTGAGVTATDNGIDTIDVTIPGGGGGSIAWYDFSSNLYPVGAADWAAGFSGAPQIGVLSGLIFFRGSVEMVGASGQGVVIVDAPVGALPSAYRPSANRFINFETSSFSNDPTEVGWQGTLRLGSDGHLKLFTTLSSLMRNGARRLTSGFEPQDTILLDGLFCAV